MVSCGAHHTAVLVSGGYVFMFGFSEAGELGLDDAEEATVCALVERIQCLMLVRTTNNLHLMFPLHQVPTPLAPSMFANQAVISVACGYKHTCACAEGGGIYSWGENGKGQLGLGASLPVHLMQFHSRSNFVSLMPLALLSRLRMLL